MSDDVGRMVVAPARLAGRLGARRAPGRGRGAEAGDRGIAEPGLPDGSPPGPSLPGSEMAMPAGRAAVDRDAVLDRGARGRDGGRLAGAAPAVGCADCIVLAAVMSAFAAEVIALVAVFIDCIADDIVRADAVAFVAAAVIFVAAEVTLVAADVTPRAAVAGVAAPRPVGARPVGARPVGARPVAARPVAARPVVARVTGLRLVADVTRDAVAREAVDRDAVLRVDRDAVLRGVALDAVLRAGVAAELRPAIGVADDVPELDADFDRLAVPRDALRLTGLLRAELAELRRVAARVVD